MTVVFRIWGDDPRLDVLIVRYFVWLTSSREGVRTGCYDSSMSLRMLGAMVALATAGCAQQQEDHLVFNMLQRGPLPVARTVANSAGQQWKANLSGASWAQLPAAEGTGPIRVAISVDAVFKEPGDYSGRLTVSSAGTERNITISLHVVPRAPGPKFTYVSEPKGCSVPPGMPLPDQALCVVTDEKPPGNFKGPAKGESYRDPNFGALVRAMTSPLTLHAYSTPNPLSAHNRYLLVGNMHAEAAIIEVATGRVVSRPATPFETVVWDAKDDEKYYYPSGARIIQFTMKHEIAQTLVDYGRAPFRLKNIINGGSTDTTKDNWMGFWAPADQKVCALDIGSLKTYCASYAAATIGMNINPDNGTVLISKGVDKQSGKRYVWIVGQPCGAMYSVNFETGKLDFEHLGPELPDWPGNGDGVCQAGERCITGDHYDMAEDENGIQYFVGGIESQQPCEYSIYSFQLNKGTRFTTPAELGGGRKKLMTLFRCGGDVWTDYHVGCSKGSPYCVFSTTYGAFRSRRQAQDPTPLPRGPHVAEVLVVKVDATEVRRLMKNRSVPFAEEPGEAYWSTPRGAISNDGAYVVVDSNFGEPNQQRVVLVETGLAAGNGGK